MIDMSAERVVDKTSINGVIQAYTVGVATKQWDLFRSCFVDDVVVNLNSGLIVGMHRGADSWVEIVSQALKKVGETQQAITKRVHSIDGNISRTVACLQTLHIQKDLSGNERQYLLGGYYDYNMVRTKQGWKINRYRLNIKWSSGDRTVLVMPLDTTR